MLRVLMAAKMNTLCRIVCYVILPNAGNLSLPSGVSGTSVLGHA